MSDISQAEPTIAAAPGHVRYHALDSLRAVMMLLGLLLHTATSYTVTDLGEGWPYKDRSTTAACDFFVFLVHVFRMPVFFVMAGFFAALLCQRRTLAGLLKNRVIRIAVPFAIGWVVMFPLVVSGFHYAFQYGSAAGQDIPPLSAATFRSQLNHTMHLWFLYYLLIYYVLTAILVCVVQRLPPNTRTRLQTGARWLVTSRWRVLLLALPTFVCLLTMRGGALATSDSFTPNPFVLMVYALFFGVGWLLYLNCDSVPTLVRGAWLQSLLALLLLFPVNFLAITTLLSGGETGFRFTALVVAAGSAALMTWLLVFGITGLFLKYCNRHWPLMRYLTDASYWLYLAHLPLVLWLVALLAPYNWPALLKMAVVLGIALPILLASYHFLVRPSFIGQILNGRRYPVLGKMMKAKRPATESAAPAES